MATIDTDPGKKRLPAGGIEEIPEANLRDDKIGNVVKTGNANKDQVNGWFIGQFLEPESGLRCRNDLEVKWGVHPVGEERPGGWSMYRKATTVSILIEGSFTLLFRGPGWQQQVKLENKGDYVIFAPGVEHYWVSDADSVVLTVRSPSVADDKVVCED